MPVMRQLWWSTLRRDEWQTSGGNQGGAPGVGGEAAEVVAGVD